jgi:hypothetical protein
VSQQDDVGDKLFRQMMDMYIRPGISERQAKGQLGRPLVLRAAQVLLYADGRAPQVRVNDEVRGTTKFKLKEGVRKAAGDPIYEDEIIGIQGFDLLPDDEPDCGHVTVLRVAGTWSISFSFIYNRESSEKHLQAAKQFFDAAEFSLSKASASAFVDNLFSCVELLTKTTLFAMAHGKPHRETNHAHLHSVANRFAKSGIFEKRHAELFNRLAALRGSARYLDKPLSLSDSDQREMLQTAAELLEHTRGRVVGYKIGS